MPDIRVIIPAFNEENAVGKVVADIPKNLVSEVIVVNNGSTDRTDTEAAKAGATVLHEHQKGYGNACLKGMAYCASLPSPPDIIVFLDADYSDYPQEMEMLVQPILNGTADMVIGSRALGQRAKHSMTPQQIFGNWLATTLMRLIYKASFTDLGPFRAIKWRSLQAIGMTDKTYGWTIEMQIKVLKAGFPYTELPVTYRERIGFSKVSGTLKGTILAGYKILWTIFKYI